ncbi:MAG: hypothetical protein ABI690_36505, partial [Chloroflexota bacterium]
LLPDPLLPLEELPDDPGVLGRCPKLLPDPLLPLEELPDDPGVPGRCPKLLPDPLLPLEELPDEPLPDPLKRDPDCCELPPPKLLPDDPDEPLLPDEPDEPKRDGEVEPLELLGLVGPLPGRLGPTEPGKRDAEDGPLEPLPDILVRPALEPGKFEAGRLVNGFTRDCDEPLSSSSSSSSSTSMASSSSS